MVAAMTSSRRRILLTLTFLAGAASTGCGDDVPVTPDAGADPWPDLGAYDQPADFPRDECTVGTFDDAELQGVYHAQIDFDGFVQATAFRLDDLGDGAWSGVIAGRDDATVGRDGSDVILRFENPDLEAVRALDLCRRDADGTVHGSYTTCNRDECFTGAVSGVRLDRIDGPVADGLTLLGELGPWPVGNRDVGITVNVRVADDVAYLARYQDGLRIVDVADPANPVEIGHLEVEYPDDGEIYNDVKLIDAGGARYALMASDLVGTVVVDVTTPSAPAIVRHFGTAPSIGEPTDVHSIFLDGTRAYLANTSRGSVEIYDVADPLLPVRLGEFRHPDGDGDGFCHDLYVAGDRMYGNWWQLGMAIVDVSNPATPTLIGNFEDYGETTSHSSWVTQVGPRQVAVHGDEQWGAHVHIVDVTEGSVDFGNSIGEWETRPEVSIHNVMAMGDRAILSHYQDGVRVLDLSDPTAPTEIAHFDTIPGYDRRYGYSFFEGAVGIDLDTATNRIYVADSHRGLLVLHLDR